MLPRTVLRGYHDAYSDRRICACSQPAGGGRPGHSITYPVPVPQEGVQLHVREHVSTTIENRYQALTAEYKLARLSKADPIVARCREAVERLRAASKS
jgi:hypothetical protein